MFVAEFPLPKKLQIMQKQFFEASDWFKAYNNEGSSLICARRAGLT